MTLPNVKTKTIMLHGGLDLESPSISVPEGFGTELMNVEPNLMGGYRKMLGYERYDGQRSPSEHSYHLVQVDDASLETVGTTFTASISGTVGYIISIDTDLNLIGWNYQPSYTGQLELGDVLINSTVTEDPTFNAIHPDPDTDVLWDLENQNYFRAGISAPSLTGGIRGVWRLRGETFALVQENSRSYIYKASGNGWVVVPQTHIVYFDTGVLEEGDFVDGVTVTGLTSGASESIIRFVKTGGTYGVDVTGYFTFNLGGTPFSSGEALQVGGVTKATTTGISEEIALSAGSFLDRPVFVNYNFPSTLNDSFFDPADNMLMFWVTGSGTAMSFDGFSLCPIFTGLPLADDIPSAIEVHKNYLFLGFKSGSLQHSSLGDPFSFSPLTGAAELYVGTELRTLRSVGGDTLMISTAENVQALYGSSAGDWVLSMLAPETGDVASTLQILGAPIMLTARGIVRIDASDKYGNYESATLSRKINPLLRNKLKHSTVTGTTVVRDKNQYKIYFIDGTGIMMTYDYLAGDQSLPSFTTFDYSAFDDQYFLFVGDSVDDDTGEEWEFFGIPADNGGLVYRLEKGFNLDGATNSYIMRFPFHHLGSPSLRKTFKRLSAEIDSTRSTTLRMTYEFSDGQSHTARSVVTNYDLYVTDPSRWNEVKWDDFLWDTVTYTRPTTSLNGTGHNISLLFYGNSATDTDFTVSSVTYQYLPRRLSRG